MNNSLSYKGYLGTVEFSAEDNVFFGRIAGIRDVVSFEGTSVKSLTNAFRQAVNDYLETCRQLGKDPDKAYKGSFNVRVKPHIHRMASMKSQALNISLNQYVERVLEKDVLASVQEPKTTSYTRKTSKRSLKRSGKNIA